MPDGAARRGAPASSGLAEAGADDRGAVGFFAVTLAYVRACDGIIGRNATGTAADTTTDDPVPRRGRAVSADNVMALVLAVVVTRYLVATLVLPQRF